MMIKEMDMIINSMEEMTREVIIILISIMVNKILRKSIDKKIKINNRVKKKIILNKMMMLIKIIILVMILSSQMIHLSLYHLIWII